jgi:hypothetical protein
MPSLMNVRPDPAPVKSPLPFAALPHALRRDPRLTARAIVTAAALLEYARDRPSCWPSNARLARDMHCSPRTVRYALAALQAAGWVSVRHGADNATGRLIVLAWRVKVVAAPRQSVAVGTPAGDCHRMGEGGREEERPSSDAGSMSPPPPAGDGGDDAPATAEELARFHAWADGPNPVMARFGRAALRTAGVDVAAPTPPCPALPESPAGKSPESQSGDFPGENRAISPEMESPRKVIVAPSATHLRVPAAPSPRPRVASQVPGPAGTTMRKARPTQPCVVGLSQLLGEAIQWPLNRDAHGLLPARPRAGP